MTTRLRRPRTAHGGRRHQAARQPVPDAKLLAAGRSLLPLMKLRFAQPRHLIDPGKIAAMFGIALGAWAVEGGEAFSKSGEAKRAKTEVRLVAPTSPGWFPWAQAVIPSGAGFSRVAAAVLLPPTLLEGNEVEGHGCRSQPVGQAFERSRVGRSRAPGHGHALGLDQRA